MEEPKRSPLDERVRLAADTLADEIGRTNPSFSEVSDSGSEMIHKLLVDEPSYTGKQAYMAGNRTGLFSMGLIRRKEGGYIGLALDDEGVATVTGGLVLFNDIQKSSNIPMKINFQKRYMEPFISRGESRIFSYEARGLSKEKDKIVINGTYSGDIGPEGTFMMYSNDGPLKLKSEIYSTILENKYVDAMMKFYDRSIKPFLGIEKTARVKI
jgi:hypothetical protein